ncbi:MAG: hypothetical protein AB1499_04140, partial [Nitrospirota bacterium]
AFLGRVSELRKWKGQLTSVVVCELSGDLGLVPMTGKLFQELRDQLGEEADQIDATLGYATYPSSSHAEGVRRWGREASVSSTIAYVSLGEFGNQSHEEVTLWSGGREVLSQVNVRAVLEYFRDQAGLDLGNKPINLERHQGEDAAEKWAASAKQEGLGWD